MKHLLAATILSLSVTACSDDARVTAPPSETGTTEVAVDAAPDTTITTTVVTDFDPKSFELAEGIALRDGKAYVSLAPLGRIVEVSPDGTRKAYATVPAGYNNGYTLGLVFSASNELYVAQTVNAPDAGAPPHGIYKIPAGGGDVTTPFATDDKMVFPNGIAVDAAGNLLVTDSATGRIHKITTAGAVSTWKEDPELAGSTDCKAPLPFPIGANGIVATDQEVFVTNTSKGSLLSIVVNADGSAGAVKAIVKDCKNVGFDGLARDSDGTFLIAQNGSPGKLVRVSGAGTITIIKDNLPLDGPASVAIGTWKGARSALITNSAFFSIGKDGGAPKPSLISITL